MLALLNVTHFVTTSGYAAIFVLSILQSCCVPTSSELTLGVAGYLAYKHQLNLPAVILVGAGGELVGAYVAWFVGRYAGRGFVDRFGKYLLLTHRDLDRAEDWYGRHGNWGVFGGRLIPVIRNFVAVPAGVAEVPLLRFGVLTALGSLIWDGAWALIGYGVGSSYNKVAKDFSYVGYVLGVLAVIAIVFVIVHRYRSYKEATSPGTSGRHVPAHRSTSRVGAPSDPVSAPPGGRPVEAPAPGVEDGTGARGPVADGRVSRRRRA